jgi:hypothetical protein
MGRHEDNIRRTEMDREVTFSPFMQSLRNPGATSWVYPVRNKALSGSFQRGKPMNANENTVIRRALDPKNPPPLTAEKQAELEALEAMPDDRIDYSDAPYLPNAVWVRASDRVPKKDL